jgi:hypothetical protein
MKRKLLLFTMLCVAYSVFAQLKVNNDGNTGIGAPPDSKSKLLVNYNLAATDTLFGLNAIMNNTNADLNKPLYGIYSDNANNSISNSLYGAYFKNTQTGSAQQVASPPLYGVYIDNSNNRFANSTYGVYTNNNIGGYSNSVYGYYADNSVTAYGGNLHGFYAQNTLSGHTGNLYGVYLDNSRNGNFGTAYGIYSTNTASFTVSGSVYGAYLSAAATSANVSTYGIYSTVSGGNANNRYAGYFTGGKVVVMDGTVGIGKNPTAGLLDVAGDVYANGVKLTSDERLKTSIQPLSDEKEKLYLLQGKSYKKILPPTGFEEDSLVKKREIIEFPEYGYLAQELKDVFPDLVSQDSTGYYAVNYIGLIPVIIEALKDQRTLIEELQKQIDELKNGLKGSLRKSEQQETDVYSLHTTIDNNAALYQNAPNPFNQSTQIKYYLPSTVTTAFLCFYDLQGKQLKQITLSHRGEGFETIFGSQFTPGIYLYALIADGQEIDVKKMILTE